MGVRIVSGRNAAGGSSGYVLFGVLVGITLLGVGMSAAVTLWSRVVQREREAELLFRGEAVVRALERYQQDRPGALPETLEELVEGRYLRRAWRDPMTGENFQLLRTGAEAGAGDSAETGAAGSVGAGTGRAGTIRSGSAVSNRAGEEPRPRAAGRAGRSASEEPVEGDGPGGITGVVSTSDLLSFRAYQGARRYRDWRFEVQASGGGAAAGNAADRGADGRREER